MLDLETEVAAGERQQRAGMEVRRPQHLPEIPLGMSLMFEDIGGEFLCAIREVTAEDHGIRPEVAQEVGYRVGAQGPAPVGTAQRREEHVVLDGLARNFSDERPPHLCDLRGIWRYSIPLRMDTVKADTPLEDAGQQQVPKRLEQMGWLPRLIAGNPYHPEAKIVVDADHVAEHVVAVVVRIPPLR